MESFSWHHKYLLDLWALRDCSGETPQLIDAGENR